MTSFTVPSPHLLLQSSKGEAHNKLCNIMTSFTATSFPGPLSFSSFVVEERKRREDLGTRLVLLSPSLPFSDNHLKVRRIIKYAAQWQVLLSPPLTFSDVHLKVRPIINYATQWLVLLSPPLTFSDNHLKVRRIINYATQ